MFGDTFKLFHKIMHSQKIMTLGKKVCSFFLIFSLETANPSSEAAMPTECTPRLELNLSNVSKSIFFLLIKWNPILLEQPVLKEPIF